MAMGEQRKGALQFNPFLLNDLTKRLNQHEMVGVDGWGGGRVSSYHHSAICV